VTLSIIIVNYNVKFFLEQCLCSVKKAIDRMEAEVIVVDNNSSDGSMGYIQPKFPWVKFILNPKNEGFSKANNLALSDAKAKFVLFLNPDTIVAEDSFEKCISFLETCPQAGSVGVKMIDGRGKYLKESKRGFPTPWVSFCKLSGLTALFPRTKFFSRYYLGYLNEKENHEIDIISGAYMMVKKKALDKTGGFDERFFMYGEDIDLSYRIRMSGFKNYYLAETTIIHFKGESTIKDLKNIKLFYQAMSIFAQKHFSKHPISFIIIQASIWIYRALAAVKNILPRKSTIQNMESLKFYLVGDGQSKIALGKIISVENEVGANNIIFCEGEKLSFKKIIEIFQKKPKISSFFIHAFNSSYFIGTMIK